MKVFLYTLLLAVVLAGCANQGSSPEAGAPAELFRCLQLNVLDTSGRAIPQVNVVVTDTAYDTLETGVTDSAGFFQADSLRVTVVRFWLSKAGYYTMGAMIPLDETIEEMNWTLDGIPNPTYRSLQIVVRDTSGNSLENAQVRVFSTDDTLLAERYTRGDGTTEVDSLMQTAVALQVTRDGYLFAEVHISLPDTMNNASISMIPSVPPHWFALRVTVQDSTASAVPDARVDVYSMNRRLIASGTTNSTGFVQLDYQGTADVIVSAKGTRFVVSEVRYHMSDSLDHLTIQLNRYLEFSLTLLDGEILDGRSLLGRVVVFEYWDTWCSPCRTQLSTFTRLDTAYEDDGLSVIGIAFARLGADAVREFVSARGISFPNAVIDDNFETRFGPIVSIPRTFVIDRSGNLALTVSGLHEESWWISNLTPLLFP